MFEITPDDIAHLNDEQLRAVVARLCEAELRQRGLSPSHVTWGGDQNAADGGIDVRVALPAGTTIDGFIPRAATGFQVKQQDMPPAEVDEEMRPKPAKKLRPAIQALADVSGAYIIVSSQGSTADAPLKNRREAMSAATVGEPNADQLALDFYDRTRIATWVRSHEGLIPWVRELVGRNIPGWHSYGPWANPSEPMSSEYLVDEKVRLHASKGGTDGGVSVEDGIRQLRDQLRAPRNVVRLVGLSGVGKTRLVQALFDDRIGEQSLNPTLAVYTNMADSPDPQPIALASDLVAGRTLAILVVDNCTPELHRRLSEVCRQPQSTVSVITVEYDIREDEPEGTEIFRLDTSSPDLTEKLVRQRFPGLSQVDARTIAEFSGGNARIAIALAGRIEHNETVAGLTDEQLFQRLFEQRHNPDESLYIAAQACSLVYSFEGEDISDEGDAELLRLGKLISIDPQGLYRHVAELHARDLVQQRSTWRAVLPHAIANRLAAVALKRIPYAGIEQQLLTTPSGRLMKSFARRLGYLHASKEAVTIVMQWLDPGGLLENVAQLNDIGRTMFQSIAPVAPDAVISALERTCAQQASACEPYIGLVRSVAYEPAHFERCIELLVKIIVAGENKERSHAREVFTSLFHLYLSGTHASIGQRLAVLEALLGDADPKRQALGIVGLQAVLEAWHFHSVSEFDFGARPRDFGFWPRTIAEVQQWFSAVLQVIDRWGTGTTMIAAQVRTALAQKFRGVWNRSAVRDELMALSQTLNNARFWREGWLAVRQTLDFDGKGMPPEVLAQLISIEHALRPKGLQQKVRSIVLTPQHHCVDLDEFEDHTSDDIGKRIERTEAIAKELGIAVASDDAVFEELLPELVSSDGHLWSFGEGLHAGSADPAKLWNRIAGALAATEEQLQRPMVLRGILNAIHRQDSALAAKLLDQCVDHMTLALWYPFLQITLPIDEGGVARLKRSLALGKTPAAMYTYLMYGRATDPIPAADLRDLLREIARLPDGFGVAIDILYMRLHSDSDHKKAIAPELSTAGCELLRRLSFVKKHRDDHRINQVAQSCLGGEQGAAVVRELCARLKAAVAKYEAYAFEHDDLLAGLFQAQPIAALDALCGGDEKELEQGVHILRDVRRHKDPLAVIPEDELLRWCDEQPQTRYVAMAAVIPIVGPGKAGVPGWTPIALQFLQRAPDPAAILSVFTSGFMPSSDWSGSLASILEGNARLLDQLDAFPALQTNVAIEKERVQGWIEGERSRERMRDRQRDERFE